VKHKIRFSLSAILVIVVISVYIIMSFSRYSFLLHNTYEQDLQEQLLIETKQSSDIINICVKQEISDLSVIAEIIGKNTNSIDKNEIAEFKTKYSDKSKNLSLGIALPNGELYLYNGGKKQIANVPLFKQAIGGKNVVSNKTNTIFGEDGILTAVPIKSKNNIIGIILRYVDTQKINDLLKKSRISQIGKTWIVEKNGRIVFSSDLENIELNIYSDSVLHMKNSDDIEHIKKDINDNKKGNTDVFISEDKYYLSYMPIGLNDWYVITSVPDRIINQKFHQVYNYSVYFVLNFAAAVIILGVFGIVSQQINKKKIKKANTELRLTKAKLETFIANLPGGAFRCSSNDKLEFRFISDGLLKIFGYTLDEFYKKFDNSFINIIYEKDSKKTLNDIKRQIEKGNFAEVKYRIQTSSGEIRWILNRTQLVFDENGGGEFYSVCIDITESKVAHKKANEAMHQLESLANSIPGGVAQYIYDSENIKLTYASNGFYKLCGYNKKECEKMSGDPLIVNAHPEDAKMLISEVTRQIAQKNPIEVEYRLIQKDGNIIWISLSGTRAANPNNQVIYQCIYTDITSLKLAQQELEAERERYQIVENLSDDILFEYDILTDSMEFSPLYTALTGKRAQIPNFLRDILNNDSICKDDLYEFKTFLNEFKIGNSQFSIEFRFKTRAGEFIWHRIKAKVIFDIDGKAKKAVGKAYNINLQKKEMQRLTEKTQRDPLTNLYNKIATQTQIEDYITNGNTNMKHAMLMIDIDNFKSVNDNFGHLVGDEVITVISKRLQNLFRTTDIVGRIGGDEFVVFLRDVNKKELITEKAKEICGIFRDTIVENCPECKISGSVGIALYPNDGKTYEELYRKADMALYKTKKCGKNGYELYSDIIN
jgi:diguanylate cyclase (GGDEF)-like protein/PAS domain S-box-containing protein